jgi:hypothetical protein
MTRLQQIRELKTVAAAHEWRKAAHYPGISGWIE